MRWGTWTAVVIGLAMLAGGLHECIRDIPFESGGEAMPGVGAYQEIGTRLVGAVLILFGSLVSSVALAFAVQSDPLASGPPLSSGGEEETRAPARRQEAREPPGIRRATPVTSDDPEDEPPG